MKNLRASIRFAGKEKTHFRFRVYSGNNENIHTSQPYTRKWNCKDALKRLFPDVTNIEDWTIDKKVKK